MNVDGISLKKGITMTDEMMDAIRVKLNPRRFPNMSGKMAAIVGYLLDDAYTNPAIVEMCVTSDQMVLARLDGDVGCNQFIGSYADLFRNWRTLITTPGVNLTTEEAAACIDLLTTKLDVHGDE